MRSIGNKVIFSGQGVDHGSDVVEGDGSSVKLLLITDYGPYRGGHRSGLLASVNPDMEVGE